MDKRNKINEENLIYGVKTIERLDDLVQSLSARDLDSEMSELLRSFHRMIFESTLRLFDNDKIARRSNHLEMIVQYLDRGMGYETEQPSNEMGERGEYSDFTLYESMDEYRRLFQRSAEIIIPNLSSSSPFGGQLSSLISKDSLRPDDNTPEEYWNTFVKLVMSMEMKCLIPHENRGLNVIVIDRLRSLENYDFLGETDSKYLKKAKNNDLIELDEETIVFLNSKRIFNVRGEWRREATTSLEKFDLINIQRDDWSEIKHHFEFSNVTLNGVEMGEFDPGGNPRRQWLVKANSMGNLELVSLPTDEEELSEDEKKAIESEILDWILGILEDPGHPHQIPLDYFELVYLEEFGMTLESKLTGTGLDLESLASKLDKLGKVIRINTEYQRGGLLQVISDDMIVDLIMSAGFDNEATQDFLGRWSLPSDPNQILRSLEHLSQTLMATPHEEWRKLTREYSQWKAATITRVISERARKNSRWKSGPKIRIDPYALASMKIEFVMEKAREDPQVDYLSVRDRLYRLFGEVSEAEEIYSIGRRDIKAREKEAATRQEKIQREERRRK